MTANSRSETEIVTANSLSHAARSMLHPARLLKEARAHAGLSQRELARRAGTAQSVVTNIETGKASPTVETLLQLLHAAGFEAVVELILCPDTA